jgi:WD40 repeat protein
MDGTVAVWDVAAGGQLLHIGGLKGHHKPVRSLAFTPGGFTWVEQTITQCFYVSSKKGQPERTA